MSIVLNVLQARPFGFDAHVDVFGDQANKRPGIVSTQPQRHVDNAVVVGLILIGIEKRDGLILCNQLIGKNGESAQPIFIQVGARDIDPLLNFLGRRVAHDFVDQLYGNTRLATHALVAPVLDVIEFFEHGHGNHDLVLCESGNCCGVMQQDVSVQYVDFSMCRFELGDFMSLGCNQRHESSLGAVIRRESPASDIALWVTKTSVDKMEGCWGRRALSATVGVCVFRVKRSSLLTTDSVLLSTFRTLPVNRCSDALSTILSANQVLNPS